MTIRMRSHGAGCRRTGLAACIKSGRNSAQISHSVDRIAPERAALGVGNGATAWDIFIIAIFLAAGISGGVAGE